MPPPERGTQGEAVVRGDGGRVRSRSEEDRGRDKWRKTGRKEEDSSPPPDDPEPSQHGTDGEVDPGRSSGPPSPRSSSEPPTTSDTTQRTSSGPTRSDDDLPRSYDFAKDDEAKEKLRAELEKLRQEKKAKGVRNQVIRNARVRMDEDRQKVLVTWIGRTEGVKHVKKAMKELLRTARSILPTGGAIYTICEHYDTYLKGGLYPVLHLSEEVGTITKFLNGNNYLEPDALGPDNMLDQGMFEEVASVSPPMQGAGTTNTVLAVSAFKSIEPSPNAKLIKEWKQWTGARAFLQDIMIAGLQCLKIRFLVKVAPFEEPGGFYYILLMEVAIHEPNNEGMIVDILQRFRVERWSGYNTIYRKAQ